ncbi:hypothetical protein GCM10027416_15230 [Okibacterium endophyticum]
MAAIPAVGWTWIGLLGRATDALRGPAPPAAELPPHILRTLERAGLDKERSRRPTMATFRRKP